MILGVVISALGMSSHAAAQVSWVYGECPGPLTPSPFVRSYSVESFVTGDPRPGGTNIANVSVSALTPVAHRDMGQGAVAVDKINKIMYVTDGNLKTGTIEFTIVPLSPALCSPGNGGVQTTNVAIGGTYPFTVGELDYPIVGAAIEYWENPNTGNEEPFRMWLAATDPVSGVASLLSFWWMAPTADLPQGIPPVEAQGNWYAGSLANPSNQRWNLDHPVRDIAFGLVRLYEEGDEHGNPSGGVLPHIFGLNLEFDGIVRVVDAYDISALLTNNGTVALKYSVPTLFLHESDHYGVALDTSMPQDLGPDSPPIFGGPLRQVSGRLLVYGIDRPVGVPRVRDVEMSGTAWVVNSFCPPGASTHVAAMDYSAELVSLGAPQGTTCPGAGGGAFPFPSDVRGDIFPVTGTLHGQPLVEPKCPEYQDMMDHQCNNDQSPLAFKVEACGTAASLAVNPFTPFLLLQKNGVSPRTINGQTLLLDPLNPAVQIVQGARNGPGMIPPQVEEPSSFGVVAGLPLIVPIGMKPMSSSTTTKYGFTARSDTCRPWRTRGS